VSPELQQLVGPLGLPGAVLLLLGCVLLGIKIRKEFTPTPTTNGHSGNGYGYKEAHSLTQGVRDQLTGAEKSINDNVDDTRHSINGNLEIVIERLAREMELQTKAIVAAIRGRGES